jgi:hypothetical protein
MTEGIECGLRPLRAVGSLYEPEAIGAYAYAPAGMRKEKEIGIWESGIKLRSGATSLFDLPAMP